MAVRSRKRKQLIEEGELEDEDDPSVPEEKKSRPLQHETQEPSEQRLRRKQRCRLYRRIKEQMEFYFSEANLTKDRYLMEVLNGNSIAWIELQEFLSFNKIKALTNSVRDIRKAILHSELLEVSSNLVRRRTPFTTKKNADACTLYVEGIPSTADVDWIRQLFGDWGNVAYVSLPRFRSSGKCKGFAFIEFETDEDAIRVVQAFAEAGCYRSVNALYTSAPLSFVLQDENRDTRVTAREVPTKTPFMFGITDSEREAKRAILLELEAGKAAEGEMNDGKKKKKRRRKRRKKRSSEKVELDLRALGLTVMSKSDWKILRNKYLTLQRKNAANLKKQLKRFSTPSGIQDTPVQLSFGSSVTTSRAEGPCHQLSWGDREKLEAWRKLSYRPGVIVKIFTQIDSDDSLRTIRNLIDSVITPEQIDVQLEQDLCFVRCRNPLDAKKFATSPSFTAAEILTGVEEAAYWQELFDKRLKKLRRGRSKLAVKAQRLLKESERRIHEETLGQEEIFDVSAGINDLAASSFSPNTAILTLAGTSTGSLGCVAVESDEVSESEEDEISESRTGIH